MGPFTYGGDYFEGDLAREPTPKLSIALTYSMNNGAIRTGGQIGFPLYEIRDIRTEMTDLLFKYRGFAFASEFLWRNTENPITTNEIGEIRYVYSGFGQNYQTSYLFKNDTEIVGRYTQVNPYKAIDVFEKTIYNNSFWD
jgi:phosphate-selective porin OprO/OprP